jgi:hypothetical protein
LLRGNNNITKQHTTKFSEKVGNGTVIYNGVKTYFLVMI